MSISPESASDRATSTILRCAAWTSLRAKRPRSSISSRIPSAARLDIEATRELAAKIVAKSAHSIRIGKDMFYKQIEMDLSEALFYGAKRMACNMDSHDAREGFDAFLQKRKPTWKHE